VTQEQAETDLPVNLLQTRMALQPGHNRYQRCEHGDYDQQQWLFILATGRSGSTSILEMVNAIPGYFLAGENEGIMSEFVNLMKHRERQKQLSNTVAWHSGWVSDQRLLCVLQDYARENIGWNGQHPHTVGFKEIRHTEKEEWMRSWKFSRMQSLLSTLGQLRSKLGHMCTLKRDTT